MSVALLVGTRKGAFILKSDKFRARWELSGPSYLGHVVNHVVLDPRDPETALMAARAWHLGPTVFRSTDGGLTWKEAEHPPQFPKAPEGEKGRAVEYTFWLAPGHASEPGVWYAGTSPQGLFRSEDGGKTWQETGFNEPALRNGWMNPDDPQRSPPGGATTHSIIVDPRDKKHLYVGLSTGGFFESRDGGKAWQPLNKGLRGDFLPDPNAEFGHDVHCVRLAPTNPDRLYQQNHFGVYRLDHPSTTWTDIGKNLPEEVGDRGFPIEVDPRNADRAWICPMDGTDVWPRTSPGACPGLFVTEDGGATWRRQSKGMPDRTWWTVYRQSLSADGADPLGLYFGTASGEVWGSTDEGETWRPVVQHLPPVLSVEAASLA